MHILCKNKLFVSFVVFKKDADTPMFEISWRATGRYLYKNKQRFEDPPYFEELFNRVQQIKRQKIIPKTVDSFVDYQQTLILKFLSEHTKIL